MAITKNIAKDIISLSADGTSVFFEQHIVVWKYARKTIFGYVFKRSSPLISAMALSSECHTLVCLEDGSVIFEAKGRAYDPVKTEQAHALLNSTIAQIVRALDAQGVPSVLLKGQGIAQNYLRPESRTCGDIDMYTGHGGYQKAFEVIEALHEGRPHKEAAECEHHLHTSLNGVEVEIHRLASFLHGRRMDANFQKWTKDSLDDRFGTGSLEIWDNAGAPVALAPATFNAFFILHHAVRHMTTEGVGFRQICDWVMLLHICGIGLQELYGGLLHRQINDVMNMDLRD